MGSHNPRSTSERQWSLSISEQLYSSNTCCSRDRLASDISRGDGCVSHVSIVAFGSPLSICIRSKIHVKVGIWGTCSGAWGSQHWGACLCRSSARPKCRWLCPDVGLVVTGCISQSCEQFFLTNNFKFHLAVSWMKQSPFKGSKAKVDFTFIQIYWMGNPHASVLFI